MSLHATDILNICAKAGISRLTLKIRDRLYSLPSKRWITGTFAMRCRLDCRRYEDDAWDCEDIADEASVLARRIHADNPHRKARAGLAVGTIIYTRTSGIRHAINFFVVGKPGKEEVVFYEPQTSEIISLTEEELLSVELALV